VEDRKTKWLDIEEEGVNYFGSIYKAKRRTTTAEVLGLSNFFPNFVNPKDNQNLMEEVGREELLTVLQSFEKDKSPGPDDLLVEFFLGHFDFVEEDLRKVIEESRSTRKILAAYNATFISLITKSDNPTSFDKFRPISLCNCIYKNISNPGV